MKKNLCLLYYWSFSFYCICYWVYLTMLQRQYPVVLDVYRAARVICILILVMKMVLEGIDSTRYFWYSALTIIFLISAYQSGSWNILITWLFVVASAHVDIKVMAKITMSITGAIAMLTAILAKAGVIPSYTTYSNDYHIRDACGFTHPNQLSICILTACVALSVLYFRRYRSFHAFIQFLCVVFIWIVPRSRTEAVCLLLVILLSAITTIDKKHHLDSMVLKVVTVAFAFFNFSSLYLMYHYDAGVEWMYRLDEALSNRLDFMNHFYRYYPPKLLGQNFDNIANTYYRDYRGFLVDNAFARVYLENGILVEIILFILYITVFLRLSSKKELDAASFCLIIFSVLAFSEAPAFYISANFGLIAVNRLFSNQGKDSGPSQRILNSTDPGEADDYAKKVE